MNLNFGVKGLMAKTKISRILRLKLDTLHSKVDQVDLRTNLRLASKPKKSFSPTLRAHIAVGDSALQNTNIVEAAGGTRGHGEKYIKFWNHHREAMRSPFIQRKDTIRNWFHRRCKVLHICTVEPCVAVSTCTL